MKFTESGRVEIKSLVESAKMDMGQGYKPVKKPPLSAYKSRIKLVRALVNQGVALAKALSVESVPEHVFYATKNMFLETQYHPQRETKKEC